MNPRKIQYHHRAKQASTDENNSQILTSSPIIETKIKEKTMTPYFLNKHSEEDQENPDGNISLRHTIQSITDKDDDNYLMESNVINKDLYLTTKNNKKQILDFSIEDSDDHYAKASENLLSNIKMALDYMSTKEIKTKNKEKIPTIKILKEDYEKLRNDYEIVIKENFRLKEKNKQMKENNTSRPTSNIDNFNLSKFLDSLTYMQSKNSELEKDNKNIKSENSELLQKLKYIKKLYSEEKQMNIKYNKNHNSKIHAKAANKNKNDMMEDLLKQQVTCMKRMICLVKEEKDSLEDSDGSVKHKLDVNDYKSDSDIHFEESFNVTNLSNSIDYNLEENHIKLFEKKNHENKSNHYNQNVSKNQKFEILLKPFEKKTENAVDDLHVFKNNKNVVVTSKANTQPAKEYNTIYLNKESNKSKILTNAQLHDRPNKKTGGINNYQIKLEGSHRLFNHK